MPKVLTTSAKGSSTSATSLTTNRAINPTQRSSLVLSVDKAVVLNSQFTRTRFYSKSKHQHNGSRKLTNGGLAAFKKGPVLAKISSKSLRSRDISWAFDIERVEKIRRMRNTNDDPRLKATKRESKFETSLSCLRRQTNRNSA